MVPAVFPSFLGQRQERTASLRMRSYACPTRPGASPASIANLHGARPLLSWIVSPVTTLRMNAPPLRRPPVADIDDRGNCGDWLHDVHGQEIHAAFPTAATDGAERRESEG